MTLRSSSAALVVALAFGSMPALAQTDVPAGTTDQQARNVVLVHGAFVDGSGWSAVYDILKADGYNVAVAQLPLTSFEDDLAAVNRELARMDGPVVLVGHSYGGMLITQAGTDPDVSALVYVAALQPEVGETIPDLTARQPNPLAAEGTLLPSEDGFLIIDPAKFPELFAADLPADMAGFMAVAQSPTSGTVFGATVDAAAWQDKPSWGIVATQDMTLNPDLERFMYERAGATVTEVEASHAVFVSQPQAVADVIEAAAEGAAEATAEPAK